ncbi:putative ubiquitin-activating enzyme [Helianthus anomalus]
MLKDGSETDAQKLISLVFSMLKDGNIDWVDEKIVRNFVFGARDVLNPMAAMFGGIVGQEVVKVCSGKFHPLLQFIQAASLQQKELSYSLTGIWRKWRDPNFEYEGSKIASISSAIDLVIL